MKKGGSIALVAFTGPGPDPEPPSTLLRQNEIFFDRFERMCVARYCTADYLSRISVGASPAVFFEPGQVGDVGPLRVTVDRFDRFEGNRECDEYGVAQMAGFARP